jgi:hypothetical protein
MNEYADVRRTPSPIPVRSKQIAIVADHNYTEEDVQTNAHIRVIRADLSNCEMKIVIRRHNGIRNISLGLIT